MSLIPSICSTCARAPAVARSIHTSAVRLASGPKPKKRVLPARLRLAESFTPDKPEPRWKARRRAEGKSTSLRSSVGVKEKYGTSGSRRDGMSSRWDSAPRITKPIPRAPATKPPSQRASATGLRPSASETNAIQDVELRPESQSFTSPPLSTGLLQMVQAQLGGTAKPTYIQSLAMQHFLLDEPSITGKGKSKAPVPMPAHKIGEHEGTETLLAAETGSGKTMAYLLPLLHILKRTEVQARTEALEDPSTLLNPLVRPRAIILAPTHELARQLAASAKALCHVDKLRVLCLSSGGWVETLKADLSTLQTEARSTDLSVPPSSRPGVDLIVSTPSRLLDVCKAPEERERDMKAYRERKDLEREKKPSPEEPRSVDRAPAMWKQRLVGLENVRTVVVDEADALFDRDFGPSTRALLHLVREAAESRSVAAEHTDGDQTDLGIGENPPPSETSLAPYDLILASATIPHSLSTYLTTHHPNLTVLRSPGLHRLPRTLAPTFVDPGGSKHAAIAAQIRKVFEAHAARVAAAARNGQLLEPRLREGPRVLIFVNRRRSVELLSQYLESRGIENIAMTGDTPGRSLRTNSHLAGFLASQKPSGRADAAEAEADAPENIVVSAEDAEEPLEAFSSPDAPSNASRWRLPGDKPSTSSPPRVLITTSLLSRGLDFSPSLSHVLLPDVARAGGGTTSSSTAALSTASSALDLLHRAGRAGRAGRKGQVVLFDRRSASDRPLRNRTGRTVGRVRGHLERVFEELKR